MSAARQESSVVARLVEQRIRYDYSKPVANLRQRLVVVPPPRHGSQVRVDWNVEVRGAREQTTRAVRDRFGNVRIEVVVPRVRASVEFDVRTTVAFCGDEPTFVRRPDERYVRPTRLTAPNDAIARLVAECGRSDAAEICAGVRKALTYEYGVTDIHTTAAEALAGGRGVCQDYAHLMLAACHVAGIRARYVSGHLLGEGGSHAWVEVLVRAGARSKAWVAEAWDPTHCRRTDDRYITIATGRDYRDVAPMSGTFDGRAHGRLTVQKHALAHSD